MRSESVSPPGANDSGVHDAEDQQGSRQNQQHRRRPGVAEVGVAGVRDHGHGEVSCETSGRSEADWAPKAAVSFIGLLGASGLATIKQAT